jgi:hypothetical protein
MSGAIGEVKKRIRECRLQGIAAGCGEDDEDRLS